MEAFGGEAGVFTRMMKGLVATRSVRLWVVLLEEEGGRSRLFPPQRLAHTGTAPAGACQAFATHNFAAEISGLEVTRNQVALPAWVRHPHIMSASLPQILVPIVVSVGGAVVAAVGAFFVGRGIRAHEWKLALSRERLIERQRLYAKFVAEADRNQLSVAVKDEKSIDNLMPLFALWAEIALLSAEPVVRAARQVCDIALATIARDAAPAEGAHYAAKAAFLEVARSEIRDLEQSAGKSLP